MTETERASHTRRGAYGGFKLRVLRLSPGQGWVQQQFRCADLTSMCSCYHIPVLTSRPHTRLARLPAGAAQFADPLLPSVMPIHSRGTLPVLHAAEAGSPSLRASSPRRLIGSDGCNAISGQLGACKHSTAHTGRLFAAEECGDLLTCLIPQRMPPTPVCCCVCDICAGTPLAMEASHQSAPLLSMSPRVATYCASRELMLSR